MPVRRMISALLTILTGAVLAVITVPALPAQAGIWHEYPTTWNTTCSDTRVYNGTAYQVCLEFNGNRTQVRAVAFINPGAYTNFQVNLRLWFGGDGPDIADSCPTMTTNASRACYTAFTDLRRPYVVTEAKFGIAGTWQLPVRALDMRLSAKQQERQNWCGPGAVQTTLATIGISAPPQSELADKLQTDETLFGATMPGRIPAVINSYIPASDWQYKWEEIAVSNGQMYEAGISRIVTSLSRGRPVMVLVIPGKLPWWNSSTPTLRHYVTITGYGGVVHADGSVHPTTFKVADPADASEHSIDVDKLLLDNANLAWNGIDSAVIVRT
ncbi:C39 family peptidase [Nonomuraea sp. NEAU-A123]|uniref:C39 family peptidase n=1 Tax=Nonomuraea sp. NEAU-A123 TaxID=2839649 RepID=UPI001BE4941F|nr:C39 family peptidase [Nonomuraea sp. NEAU-A123]MBT2227813.1 C39 family peptidase [Nonomuraea sp. NEAU-A123]